MTGWRARLAAIRESDTDAGCANGAFGANGIGMEAPNGAEVAERAAFYALRQAEAAGVLAQREPDPIEAAERAMVFGAEAAPQPWQPGDPDPMRDGLLLSALMRPPAWASETPPPPGAWCSCCGRHNPEAGGRWWSALRPRSDGTGIGPGWCCRTCHPPDHLLKSEVREVLT